MKEIVVEKTTDIFDWAIKESEDVIEGDYRNFCQGWKSNASG